MEDVPPAVTWENAMPWWQGPTYHSMFHTANSNSDLLLNALYFHLNRDQNFYIFLFSIIKW